MLETQTESRYVDEAFFRSFQMGTKMRQRKERSLSYPKYLSHIIIRQKPII